ncbi:hypothetical protein BJ684DRAFT_22189 [Piptocephalis cylindrospora]|uniref:Uncharacterized protein n=1 Tax=Piptocephalis cylindrospora TaxID=1907219 RepID=A0A4P9XYS2_9FUNG|nr:hypothetical protein BJ684DRAFT_22189 [Piptocephalis cylindrospora]|eukprot:RKP11262.1 hypothetical protein BJ684DRAFT_22189 [Piptocephalis cylindrospora]
MLPHTLILLSALTLHQALAAPKIPRLHMVPAGFTNALGLRDAVLFHEDSRRRAHEEKQSDQIVGLLGKGNKVQQQAMLATADKSVQRQVSGSMTYSASSSPIALTDQKKVTVQSVEHYWDVDS